MNMEINSLEVAKSVCDKEGGSVTRMIMHDS